MGYPLRVTFEGICAFLPSEEIRPFDPLDWVSVFMVDSRNFQPARRLHKAIVEFRLIDLVASGTGHWDPAAKVCWRLEDMDLWVRIGGIDKPSIFVESGSQGEEPREGEESDFNWVPRLINALTPAEAARRRLKYNGGQVAQVCLEPNPSGIVATRIHLNHGRLSVDELVKNQGRVTVSQFVPSEEATPLRQALSLRAALDVADVSGSVYLRGKKFNSNDWITFELRLGPGAERLQIDFKNLCDCGSADYSSLLRDEDFELFYLLTGQEVKDPKNPIELVGLPAPISVRHPPSRREVEGDGGTAFLRCTEAQLSPLTPDQSGYYYNTVIKKIDDV